MPKISVVIPVYNAEKFLVETLNSVKNQSFSDFECVLVNDGSTDKSLEIINLFIQQDQRFKVITIPNIGCANVPRFIAIQNSLGEFVFNLDADDVIENDCLEKMLFKQSETNSDIVLLTVIGCVNDLDGELYRLPFESFDSTQILTGKEAVSMTIGGWQISCNGMLFKKNLFVDIPMGVYMNSDELTSRYILINANYVSFSKAKYIYRNHNNSISRKITPRLFERILVDTQLENFVIQNFGIDSTECKKIRNTQLFNMIYLQYDFLKYKNQFSDEKKNEIANNFRFIYNSQNFVKLRKELPIILRLLFATNYMVFKICSIFYVSIKDRNGRKYLMK